MFGKLFIILRFILCLLGAGALLYTFSYPDAIIPPDPYMEEQSGLSLYALKPFLWLIPVVFMELVDIAGPWRNRIWFSALFAVLILALIAYPVLAATRPEVVAPTFSYQGEMLNGGLVSYVTFISVSLVARLVLLAYAFPAEDMQEQLEVGFVSASVLDPANARTVKEIAAEEKAAIPSFSFKAGDQRIATRFRLIMKRILLRSRIANASIAGGVLLLILWVALFPSPSPDEALKRDMRTMLEYRLTQNGYPLATNTAMHAAARVIKYISDHESLAGMSPAEAEQWLGLDKLPEGVRTWMRDSRPIKLASVRSSREIRTRFMTITDGTRYCVLYVRMNEADGSIILSEFQDSGWDAVADEARRNIGTDWSAYYK